MSLPESFLTKPFAHRGLHDVADGRPENSSEAAEAAIAKGYGIELDVQLSADGQAMVFHDYDLDRLTLETGPVRGRTAAALSAIPLSGGQTPMPTLPEFLKLVDGRVPLLLEIKDQDGALGSDVGPLEAAVAAALDGYGGEVAVMSFNPHSMAVMQRIAGDVLRGLVTESFPSADWPVPAPTLERLRGIPDYDHVGACFISHEAADLERPRVSALKETGASVLCWTIRSKAEEEQARRIAHNVTFEGYLA